MIHMLHTSEQAEVQMSWENVTTPPEEEGSRMRGPGLSWNDVQGAWHKYKGKVRQRWGRLTVKDVDYIGGHYEELAGKIQHTYNVSKEEADRQIEEWLGGRDDDHLNEPSNPSSSI